MWFLVLENGLRYFQCSLRNCTSLYELVTQSRKNALRGVGVDHLALVQRRTKLEWVSSAWKNESLGLKCVSVEPFRMTHPCVLRCAGIADRSTSQGTIDTRLRNSKRTESDLSAAHRFGLLTPDTWHRRYSVYSLSWRSRF